MPTPIYQSPDPQLENIALQLPATLGSKTAAASLAVTIASDSTVGSDLTAILAKLSADPATQTTLASILTALNTGTTHTDLSGLQTTLAAILAEQRDDVFITATLWEDRSTTVAVFYREERNRSQDDGTITTVYTRLSDNTIVGSMPVGVIPVQGATDRTIEYYRWRMKNAGTGYSAGDWVSNTIVFDTDALGAVLTSTWYNLSTSANIATAPLPADLEDPNDRLLNSIGVLDASVNSLLKPGSTLTAVTALGSITSALPAGANKLGQIAIDQTTPGVSNFVANNQTQINGTAIAAGLGASNLGTQRVAISTDSAIGISSLPGTIAADIAAIKTNTSRISQYQFHIAETTAGAAFLVRTDNSTGVSDRIDIVTGAVITPGSIELTDPISIPTASTLQVEPNEFEAITTSGTNWTIGDILTRVLIIDTVTGSIASTIWQSATGATLSTIPTVGTDVIDSDKQQLAVLRGLLKEGTVINGEAIASGSGFLGWVSWIAKNLVSVLAGVGSPSDTVAATDAGASSQIGLLKRINSKFQSGSQPLASAVSLALSRKTKVVGFVTTNVINSNLLDNTGAGLPTNVEDYSSAQITMSVPFGVCNLRLESAVDAAFTIGVSTLNWTVLGGFSSVAQIAPANGPFTGRWNVDLTGINYIRLNNFGLPLAGIQSWLTLSQLPLSAPDGRVTAAIASGQTIGISNSVTIAPPNLGANNAVIDITPSTLAVTTTSTAFTPTGGISYQIETIVTAVSGTNPTLDIQIQESVDGSFWRTVYTMEQIVAAGNYKSILLPLTHRQVRYIQTIGGVSASFNRSIWRNQSNQPVNCAIATRRSSRFNLLNAGIDLPMTGRVRRMTVNNRTAALHFLQIHDKVTAVVNGDVPIEIFQLPATSSLPFTAADLGEFGSVLAAATNPRIVVSTSFNTYTAPSAIAANTLHLFVESL